MRVNPKNLSYIKIYYYDYEPYTCYDVNCYEYRGNCIEIAYLNGSIELIFLDSKKVKRVEFHHRISL